MPDTKEIFNYVSKHNGEFSSDEICNFLGNYIDYKFDDEKIENLVNNLNVDGKRIIELATFRYFDNVMNGQIRNIYS